jgi:hypothetical protein
MDLANGAWEYPFWNMLVDVNRSERTLEHINVTNESQSLESGGVCAILLVNDQEHAKTIIYQGQNFLREFDQPRRGHLLKAVNGFVPFTNTKICIGPMLTGGIILGLI